MNRTALRQAQRLLVDLPATNDKDVFNTISQLIASQQTQCSLKAAFRIRLQSVFRTRLASYYRSQSTELAYAG